MTTPESSQAFVKEVLALMGMLSRNLELDEVSLDVLSFSMKGDNKMWMLII
jgi:hypothetical protein